MWETLITSTTSASLTAIIIGFLGKSWIQSRIKASIEHEYRKQFELFSRELDRKEKVELVADLMAEYLKTPYGEKMDRGQRVLLNKLSFKASLWLPSELSIELSKRLQNKPEAKTPFELVLMARKALINDDSLSQEHITWWSADKEKHADPIIYSKP